MIKLFWTICRARQSGLLRLKKATEPTSVECLGGECGLCCSVMGGDVVVTPDELTHLPPNTTERIGDVIILKSTAGVCNQLLDKKCSCYGVRPTGCREYPWYSIGGELFFDSGCPGIRHDLDERPNIRSISSIERFLPTNRIARSLLILLFRVW